MQFPFRLLPLREVNGALTVRLPVNHFPIYRDIPPHLPRTLANTFLSQFPGSRDSPLRGAQSWRSGHWPLAGVERDQEDMKGEERSSISGTVVTSAKSLVKG